MPMDQDITDAARVIAATSSPGAIVGALREMAADVPAHISQPETAAYWWSTLETAAVLIDSLATLHSPSAAEYKSLMLNTTAEEVVEATVAKIKLETLARGDTATPIDQEMDSIDKRQPTKRPARMPRWWHWSFLIPVAVAIYIVAC